MGHKAGVWIDHRQAIVVSHIDDDPIIHHIRSGAEPRVRMSGGARSRTPYGPQVVASEQQRDARFKLQLRRYYREVAATLRGADAILILGPGEARGELRRLVVESHHRPDVPAVFSERADKMTVRQLVARVRYFFNKARRTTQRTQITVVATTPSRPGSWRFRRNH
jgi:hypothetical protein